MRCEHRFRARSLWVLLVASGWTMSATVAAEPDNRTVLEKAGIPAFPEAEGAGTWTRGGRGGRVFVVRTLDDSGPGSFREALEATEPRTVVFGLAGIIHLKSPVRINYPFITIAGQSAPGDGVCIRGETTEINTHDVVIRHMRFRRGNIKRRDDSLGGNPVGNIMVDHVSASWGLDENLTLYRHMVPMPDGRPPDKRPVESITIQWSISSEALNLNNHAFGGTWGGRNCSFHHNLFACNTGRNPSIGMSFGFDFRNNVLFNWQHRTMDGGDGSSRVNVVNNYYKSGPATAGALRYRICKAQARNARDRYPGFGKWFVDGNFVDGFPEITANNWAGGVQYDASVTIRKDGKEEVIPAGSEDKVRSHEEFSHAPVRTESAIAAFESVLAHSGATLPKRDAVDLRVIEAVRTGKPVYQNGIIELPDDVGGWPVYTADSVSPDVDGDGMPDNWERRFNLSPGDPKDAGADPDMDGYSNIEEFLNRTDPTVFVNYQRKAASE